MLNAFKSLNPVAMVVVSLIGFFIGFLWFSPLLFVKAWIREIGKTPEQLREEGKAGGPALLVKALACTILSTTVLGTLLAAHHTAGAAKGAELGLMAGAGLVAARQAVNDMFEKRSFKYFLIVSGHDVVLLTVTGAILAVWR